MFEGLFFLLLTLGVLVSTVQTIAQTSLSLGAVTLLSLFTMGLSGTHLYYSSVGRAEYYACIKK